jgi:hypothetical protein
VNKVLTFLRIIDPHDGLISLTNVALLVVLVKIAASSSFSMVDAGALFVTLLSYQGKKLINRDKQDDAIKIEDAVRSSTDAMTVVGDLIKKVDELSSKVTQQQMSMGIKDLRK